MKTILVFSHLRWDFVFQRPQHLLSRLAEHYRIIFVEEPMWTEGGPYVYSALVTPNVRVLVPHTNEEGWGFNDAQLAVIGPMINDWLADNEDLSDGYGIWFYTPQALPIKQAFKPEFVIFDVMDELSMFANPPPQLKEREAELLKIADLVIAGGPSLWKSKHAVRPDTICIPSAVDAAHYSPHRAIVQEDATHEADKLQHHIAHPRIGFFGVIDERLDIKLLEEIADAHLDWNIVMVGPVVKIDPASLPQKKNIFWLGQQQYKILPQIVQSWDVCILPFAYNDSTKFISPTKTLEYMAAEKPIVSTAIHDVVALYEDVVEIGETNQDFISKIEGALAETQQARGNRIKLSLATVARSSWDAAAAKVKTAIDAVLK